MWWLLPDIIVVVEGSECHVNKDEMENYFKSNFET